MSEVRFYNDGKPIDNVGNSEEENNQQDNPVLLNNLDSQQELSSQVIPSDYTDDQLEQLEDTIVNKTQENEPTSMSGEVIRDVPNVPLMEQEASFFDREELKSLTNNGWKYKGNLLMNLVLQSKRLMI